MEWKSFVRAVKAGTGFGTNMMMMMMMMLMIWNNN